MGFSRFVDIKKGVKQGDMLSFILFCVALASVMLKTEDAFNIGCSLGGRILSSLSYAYDIATPWKLERVAAAERMLLRRTKVEESYELL